MLIGWARETAELVVRGRLRCGLGSHRKTVACVHMLVGRHVATWLLTCVGDSNASCWAVAVRVLLHPAPVHASTAPHFFQRFLLCGFPFRCHSDLLSFLRLFTSTIEKTQTKTAEWRAESEQLRGGKKGTDRCEQRHLAGNEKKKSLTCFSLAAAAPVLVRGGNAGS